MSPSDLDRLIRGESPEEAPEHTGDTVRTQLKRFLTDLEGYERIQRSFSGSALQPLATIDLSMVLRRLRECLEAQS